MKLKLPPRLGRHEDKVATKTGGVMKIKLPQRWGESRVRVPAGAAREFSSPASTFCADYYFGIRSALVLPQQHVKDPGHSAKSAGGRLKLNMHAPYVCDFALSYMVHGCMIYTEHAKTAAVSCGTSHASAVSTSFRWIFKNAL